MNPREADQVLVDRVKAGDQQAFALLVAKYQRKVIRLISRLIRDPAEVEDVAQEAFLKAYRALPQFRGDSAFYTCIYRIAVNTAKNHLVSQGRRPIPLSSLSNDEDDGEPFGADEAIADIQTPDAVLMTRQIAETVNRAIEALPAELRTAVTLREIEGLSYEEIADAMNCPIGTVRSRIFRAREAIAEQIRPLIDDPGHKRW